MILSGREIYERGENYIQLHYCCYCCGYVPYFVGVMAAKITTAHFGLSTSSHKTMEKDILCCYVVIVCGSSVMCLCDSNVDNLACGGDRDLGMYSV